MALLEMKLLGELIIEQDGAPLAEIKSQKGKALLCYLAVSGKEATRPFLAALLWPEMPESHALMNLRQTLQRLRPLNTHLVITREMVAFNREAGFWGDVVEFERGTAALTLRNQVEGRRAAFPQEIARLQEAIALYQGDFLEGFALPDAPLFEEWVLTQRARLREVALGALQRLVAHFGEEEAYETAVAYARQLLTIEPWHEETHRQLMYWLALSGQRSAALAQYEMCRHMLADELGVAPAVATRQLYEQIKAGQFGQGAATDWPPHNLPPQLTPFVGREAELAQLQALLAQPDVHLLTIWGPGGIGKTRLALALAERIWSKQNEYKPHPFQHGIYFASLARLETADLLLAAVAEVVQFSFRDGHDQQEQLLRYLANKAMLLVLDNFEHLLAGTALVDEILQRAPQIKMVITSRARVNRQSEQLFPLKGMAYPAWPEAVGKDNRLALSQYGAVQLFVQCARRVQPDFTLTAENQGDILQICQLLQGMPLGIVLAASWLPALSPPAIRRNIQQDIDFLATDMADVPRRQRSLRAAFKHSWRLLSKREQALFAQLSIFRGGFSRAAAQAITGATVHDLQALVNKSLLFLSLDRRYDVHELLRQFAAEKLSEEKAVEAAVRDHHSDYYCTLLLQCTPNWHNAHQLETLAEVTREAHNIQVAWEWALQHETWERLSDAIDSWGWYHRWRGLHADGEAFCQAVCDHLEYWAMTTPTAAAVGYLLWAKAMAWYGEFAMAIKVAAQRFQQSLALLARLELAGEDTRSIKAFVLLCLGNRLSGFDRQKARSCLEDSLLLYEALSDSCGTAQALVSLSSLDWSVGNYDLAQQRAEAGLYIQQEQGDQGAQAQSLGTLGWIYQHMGHLTEAEQFRHKALDLCQQLGNRPHLAGEMASLVYTVGFQGRFDEGQQWSEKSLSLCQEEGYLDNEGFANLALSFCLLLSGRYKQAHQELTHSLALVRAVHHYGVEASVHCWLGYLALVNLAYDEAQAACEEGLRLYQAVQGDAYTFLALSGLGFSTCCRGELHQSRHHFLQLLTNGLRRKDFLWLLLALPGLALYLVKRGEVKRAIEVWAQAQRQPFVANSQWYTDVVGQVVARATADLPPHIIEAARETGRSQDIWHMAESLLVDLQSGQ